MIYLSPIPPGILELAEHERPSWDSRLAAIPAWHPRNESNGGAPAATTPPPGTGDSSPAGQGGEDPLAGLYDLSSVPEALRGEFDPVLQQIRDALGQRYVPRSEHDEFRQRWEPLAGIEGLDQLHPEDVDQMVGMAYDMLAAADENHPQREQALAQLRESWEAIGNQFELWDDDGGDPAGDDPAVDGEPPAWAQQLTHRLDRIEQWQTGRDQTERTNAESEAIQKGLAALAEKHGLDEDAQNDVLSLGAVLGPDVPVEKVLEHGLSRYLSISGKAEQALVQPGRLAPGPATPGSGQAAAPPSTEGLRPGDARLKAAAKARLQGMSVPGAAR